MLILLFQSKKDSFIFTRSNGAHFSYLRLAE